MANLRGVSAKVKAALKRVPALVALKRRYVRVRAHMYWKVLHAVSKSTALSSIYYSFFDDALSREATSVLAGRYRYYADHRDEGASFYLLRRNIHRLEKGLIMRPRRPVFALEYLPETIDIYVKALRSNVPGEPLAEVLWAQDVLRAYFEAVDGSHPTVARLKAKFEGSDDAQVCAIDPAGERRVPYQRNLANAPAVDFDSFLALSKRRRSVRWYLDRPVPREMVDKAIAAAAQAPSACNRQPFVYRIFDEPERARRIAAIPLGTKGFSHLLPSVVVLVGRLRAYPLARDRHAIYIDGALSAMAFMYALESLGLSSCPINWPDIQPQEQMMARELGLEPDERVIMLIAYGWPDPSGMVPYSAKREHDQLRQFN